MKNLILRALLLVALASTLVGASIRNVMINYGALGNGAHNDGPNIDNAIAALQNGDTLLFPCGTYLVTTAFRRIAVANVIVDGSSGCATIKSSLTPIMRVGGSGLSATTPFTANSLDQASTIQANFAAIGAVSGDYLLLEEQPSSGSGIRGELVKAQTISGTTAILSTNVHQAYTTGNSATVQKVLSPVSGLNVHDLVLDGMSSSANGLDAENVINSTFANLTIKNALGGQGPQGVGGAFTPYLNYNVAFNNITVTGSKVFGFSIWKSGHLTFSGVNILGLVNNGTTGSFGMGLDEVSDSTLTNITIDSTGSGGGRSFKWESAMYNVCNYCTSGHTEGAYYAAFTIEFFSAHNTFNNCSVPGTSGNNPGIQQYEAGHANEGNNSYNTYNNCTITGTTNYPFWDHGTNDHLEINGGTFTPSSGQIGIDVGYYSPTNSAYIHNVKVNGSSSTGISLDGASTGACVNSNNITGAGTAIHANSGGNTGSGNSPNNGNLTVGACGTVSNPLASITPTSWDFGTILVGSSSAAKTFTLNNNGTAALNISSSAASPPDYVEGTGTCGATLAAGTSCTVTVTFTPGSAGTIAGTLTFSDNASGSPQVIPLTGVGNAGSVPSAPTNFTVTPQ